ncbi:SapB/AmfS family lanthipeptide [Streptomyces sparsogenes]
MPQVLHLQDLEADSGPDAESAVAMSTMSLYQCDLSNLSTVTGC